jgi:hypothetical protein
VAGFGSARLFPQETFRPGRVVFTSYPDPRHLVGIWWFFAVLDAKCILAFSGLSEPLSRWVLGLLKWPHFPLLGSPPAGTGPR